MGAIKENAGYAMGNKEMEAEGKASRDKGTAEVEGAKAKQRTKGAGEQLKGKTKDVAGSALGDRTMQAEGKAEDLQGKTRREANK